MAIKKKLLKKGLKKSSKDTKKNLINIMNKSKLSPKNIEIVKKKGNTLLYIALSITIFNIVFIGLILNYLFKLRECSCYQVENKVNYSNLLYLKIPCIPLRNPTNTAHPIFTFFII